MTEYIIEVTQEDISNGVRGFCSLCPIARALKRTFPEWDCIVQGNNFEFRQINSPYEVVYMKTSNEVRKFISRFDRYFSVFPFSFAIEMEL